MKAAFLADRGVVRVAGEDARRLLNGLLTADMGKVAPGAARYAALLTPQGKIIVDCIVVAPAEGGFLLDCPGELASAFAKRLEFYKLRAKAAIEDLSETLGVVATWDGEQPEASGICQDPRLAALGWRAIMPRSDAIAAGAQNAASAAEGGTDRYEAHRIALGVPKGGPDFAYGDAFPHEADMDQLGGVDFDKGCYVGQEVVSRMEHRGRARTRVVPVVYEADAPAVGTPIKASDRIVGTTGSVAGRQGLALVRIDRADEALAAGIELAAAGVPVRLVKPAWAQFAFPGEPKEPEPS